MAVCCKFTGSYYELCSPTNYKHWADFNTNMVQAATVWPQECGAAPLLKEPCQQRDATSDLQQETQQGCSYALGNAMLQYLKNIDFLSLLPELGKIYVTVFFYVLLFGVCPEISALWMDPKEMIQREVACIMLTGKMDSGRKLTDEKISTKMF